MMTHDERERMLYEARLKAQRDSATLVRLVEIARAEAAQAQEQGRAQGVAEGRAEGCAEGQLVGRIALCQSLLGVSSTSEGELRALPISELQARAEALERQVRAGKS